MSEITIGAVWFFMVFEKDRERNVWQIPQNGVFPRLHTATKKINNNKKALSLIL